MANPTHSPGGQSSELDLLIAPPGVRSQGIRRHEVVDHAVLFELLCEIPNINRFRAHRRRRGHALWNRCAAQAVDGAMCAPTTARDRPCGRRQQTSRRHRSRRAFIGMLPRRLERRRAVPPAQRGIDRPPTPVCTRETHDRGRPRRRPYNQHHARAAMRGRSGWHSIPVSVSNINSASPSQPRKVGCALPYRVIGAVKVCFTDQTIRSPASRAVFLESVLICAAVATGRNELSRSCPAVHKGRRHAAHPLLANRPATLIADWPRSVGHRLNITCASARRIP